MNGQRPSLAGVVGLVGLVSTGLAALAGAGCGAKGPTTPDGAPSASATVAAPLPKDPGPLELRFVGNVDFPPRERPDGRAFGGLSGLAYRARDQTVFAVSDAHAVTGAPRVYTLKLSTMPFDLEWGHRLEIGTAARAGIDLDRYDPEGIAVSPLGDLLITSEGDATVEPREGPRLDAFSIQGRRLSPLQRIPLPEMVAPTPSGELATGMRGNKGPEGLTTSPRNVFVAFEQALVQDGEEASVEAGTDVRLFRYGRDLSLQGAHHYRTDAAPGDPSSEHASLGLSELAALDDDHLLVMERGTYKDESGYHNRIRIYEIDLGLADNVLTRATLQDHDPVDKHLVLDLDTIAGRLSPTPKLDNFEGMTLVAEEGGPPTHLLLVSDDNFSEAQRTCFILFALEGEPGRR